MLVAIGMGSNMDKVSITGATAISTMVFGNKISPTDGESFTDISLVNPI